MALPIEMTLSDAGAVFIKEAEAPKGKPYLTAYDDGTGTYTIGWGCTKGVKKGMKITQAQAQQMFDAEIAPCIDAVHRLIKRDITQGLFDALVSFFYNSGWGKCPTLIKAVNSGSGVKVRQAFMLYVKAYDAKKGRMTTWPGLVNRRTAELAHWAKMDVANDKMLALMPAAVEPSKPSWLGVAAHSKTAWLKLQATGLLVMGWLTDWGQAAFDRVVGFMGVIPDVVDDTSRTLNSTDMMAGWLNLNMKSITLFLVLGCLGIGFIRHINDKRELSR